MAPNKLTWLRQRRHLFVACAYCIAALCFAMNDSMGDKARVLASVSFLAIAFLSCIGGRQASTTKEVYEDK